MSGMQSWDVGPHSHAFPESEKELLCSNAMHRIVRYTSFN